MIYEHRSYYMLPGKQREFLEAFQGVPMKVFERHGAKLVGFWTTYAGQSNEVIYLLAYPDLAAREKVWQEIDRDPDMQAYRSEPPRYSHIDVKFLRPTAFSPLQ